jgi:hypothetical protein
VQQTNPKAAKGLALSINQTVPKKQKARRSRAETSRLGSTMYQILCIAFFRCMQSRLSLVIELRWVYILRGCLAGQLCFVICHRPLVLVVVVVLVVAVVAVVAVVTVVTVVPVAVVEHHKYK